MRDSLPLIPFTSRTFIRNVKPHAYPPGTGIGLDWETRGGVYDTTDPRTPIYWGAPRPINGDLTFGLFPGETAANAVRRLKQEGFIGLYCERPQIARKHVEPERQNPNQPSRLEQIAAAAKQTRDRNESRINVDARNEGRRATRSEERSRVRRNTYEAYTAGERPDVPSIAGAGQGYISEEERRAEQQDTFPELDGVEDGAAFGRGAASHGIAAEVEFATLEPSDIADNADDAELSEQSELSELSERDVPGEQDESGDTRQSSEPIEEDDDTPIQAATGTRRRGRPRADEGNAAKGLGLAGKGGRRRANPVSPPPG